eukprot:5525925-Pleurochrysis_carterae.AAC.2
MGRMLEASNRPLSSAGAAAHHSQSYPSVLRLAVGQNPRNGCLRTPEAYILARGAITIPYHIRPLSTRFQ